MDSIQSGWNSSIEASATCLKREKKYGWMLRSVAVYFSLAEGQGFEPRLAESESAVLPLDDPPLI